MCYIFIISTGEINKGNMLHGKEWRACYSLAKWEKGWWKKQYQTETFSCIPTSICLHLTVFETNIPFPFQSAQGIKDKLRQGVSKRPGPSSQLSEPWMLSQ